MHFFPLDLSTATVEEIEKIAKEAERKFGPIEILFNNAGFCKPGMFFDINAIENARQNMELNYFGNVKVIQAIGNMMKK